MPRLEHNGPGFGYKVFYRPKGSTYWNRTSVLNEKASELEVEVNDVYGLYEIKVEAFNDIGDSYQPPFIILGHSGEGGRSILYSLLCMNKGGSLVLIIKICQRTCQLGFWRNQCSLDNMLQIIYELLLKKEMKMLLTWLKTMLLCIRFIKPRALISNVKT